MLIEWIEEDVMGRETVKEHPHINRRNAYSYAKHNKYGQGSCRVCLGRGYIAHDSAYKYVVEHNELLGIPVLERKIKEPRLITCNCVDKTLEKLRTIGKQV